MPSGPSPGNPLVESNATVQRTDARRGGIVLMSQPRMDDMNPCGFVLGWRSEWTSWFRGGRAVTFAALASAFPAVLIGAATSST